MGVLITGVSSGLGKALIEEYQKNGYGVYGLDRTYIDLITLYRHIYEQGIDNLLKGKDKLDLIILNAGILGEIKTFTEFNMEELQQIMNVNVFSNKLILDILFERGVKVKQVVSISSGASEKTYKGWGGYSISKSAMRMMMSVYSKDVPDTHFTSLAPGLVQTKMQDYLCEKVSLNEFPETSKFIESKENGTTRNPYDVAEDIIKIIPKLLEMESGGYVDLRNV
jgi:benzil reductase ((S)-benzoin forming)|tara:strand:+ start:808 stop:1479 length:672 start_codon:yes stop_codon:yes gene_type:complete